MGERHSERDREENDWYVEEPWNVDRLFDAVSFTGKVHDPCCGMGTIVAAARRAGYIATGSDIVDRGYNFPARDFFTSGNTHDNIVTNPPYKIAQKVIAHALEHARHRVAALVQLKFLAGQRRHPLFTDARTEKVIIFSRRPNMPPGLMLEEHGEEIRGGGSIDYAWVIWKTSKAVRGATIEWVL